MIFRILKIIINFQESLLKVEIITFTINGIGHLSQMSVQQFFSTEFLIAMAAAFVNLSSTISQMMTMSLQIQVT